MTLELNQNSQQAPFKAPNAKTFLLIGVSVAVVALATDCFFTIDQTQLGNVRRFGTVVYPRNAPLQPGIHFKLPFIDKVDRIQTTLQTLHIPKFDILTIDNQRVSIGENFNYTIPADKVYHVLYEVGGSGNTDIDAQVIPVVKDRTSRIFAGQNMVNVNANRELIQEQIEKNVTKSVEDLFGIKAHSLQIAEIAPSENFMRSIDAATMAKNATIAAENQLRTKQFEAQQVAATAKGAADAAIEHARGEAESVRLNAEAEKTRLALEGQGQKAYLDAQIEAFGGPDKYLSYLNAKAMLNWNGQQPQIVSGSGSGMNFVVPLPQMPTPPASKAGAP